MTLKLLISLIASVLGNDHHTMSIEASSVFGWGEGNLDERINNLILPFTIKENPGRSPVTWHQDMLFKETDVRMQFAFSKDYKNAIYFNLQRDYDIENKDYWTPIDCDKDDLNCDFIDPRVTCIDRDFEISKRKDYVCYYEFETNDSFTNPNTYAFSVTIDSDNVLVAKLIILNTEVTQVTPKKEELIFGRVKLANIYSSKQFYLPTDVTVRSTHHKTCNGISRSNVVFSAPYSIVAGPRGYEKREMSYNSSLDLNDCDDQDNKDNMYGLGIKAMDDGGVEHSSGKTSNGYNTYMSHIEFIGGGTEDERKCIQANTIQGKNKVELAECLHSLIQEIVYGGNRLIYFNLYDNNRAGLHGLHVVPCLSSVNGENNPLIIEDCNEESLFQKFDYIGNGFCQTSPEGAKLGLAMEGTDLFLKPFTDHVDQLFKIIPNEKWNSTYLKLE